MIDQEIIPVQAPGGPSILISAAAQRHDLDLLVEAASNLNMEYYNTSDAGSGAFYRSWLQLSLTRSGHYVHALKDLQGKIAGMGALEPVDGSEHDTMLHSVWIDRHYRGQGLGRTLVTTILQKAGEMGYRAVVMDATTNPIARLLYESLGFVVVENGMRLELPLRKT